MKNLMIHHSVLRLLSIVIGGVSIFLGYLLFIKGVGGEASLSVNSSSVSGQLLNAAPGIFFAVSGVIIILVGLYRNETTFIVGKSKKDASEANIPYEETVVKLLEEDKEFVDEYGYSLHIPAFIRRKND